MYDTIKFHPSILGTFHFILVFDISLYHCMIQMGVISLYFVVQEIYAEV